MHIKTYFIDSKTGVSELDAPLKNGGVIPHALLEVDLIDRRVRPSIIYGTLPEGTELPVSAVELTEQAHSSAITDYNDWRLIATKATKTKEIGAAFETDSNAPVLHNGAEWHGGETSAGKINDKALMLEYAAQTHGEIFDTSDTYHTLTIAEIRAVAFAIAQDYELKLFNYKTALKQVENATNVAEVEAINYV